MRYMSMMLGVALLAMSACTEVVDLDAEKVAVKAVLDSYVKSIIDEDMELYAENVAHDEAMVNFGGFGVPITGWEALKQVMDAQNETLSETEIDVSDVAVHVSGDGKLAWATCVWKLTAMLGEEPIELPIRCTWVLEKREDRWFIVHFHKSMPAG